MGSYAMTNSGSSGGDAGPSTEPIMTVEHDREDHDREDIERLRREIDRLDAEILAAVKRRTEVSRVIGRTRLASGGTRLVHSREMKVLDRFGELGPEGHTLAMLLLRLGRGTLGQ